MEDITIFHDYKCKFCGRTKFGSWQEWISTERCYGCKRIKTCTLLPKSTWGKVCEMYYGENVSQANIAKYLRITKLQVKQILETYNGIGEQPILLTIDTTT